MEIPMFKWFLTVFLLFIIPAKADVLTIILPVSEDSHAINARIFSKYLQKHIPSHPQIEFKVIPGAASVVAANYIYNIAPKDGNTIGVFYKNIPLVGSIGGPNINFDATKFTWLGSTADGRKDAVLVMSNKKYDGELIIGSDNVLVGDPIDILKKIWNIKEVRGYKSQSEIRLALERGEIDAMINSMIGIKTTKPEWLTPESKIKPILQFGNGNNRHQNFQNIPTLSEKLIDKKELKKFENQYILLRPYVAPPNIPKEKASELRRAFSEAAQDKDYIEEASKAGIDVNLIDWKEAQSIVEPILD
jgi:tripartite-type tricarboxylate transporter receptor subunit TctC